MISIKNVNQIWLILVLTHLGGSLLAGYAQIIPGGTLMISAAIGFCAGWLLSGGKWYKALAGVLAVTVFVYTASWGLPVGYRASLILMMTELFLILWFGEESHISVRKYCRIRSLKPGQIPFLVTAGCLMYIFCAYFNAWSEIFFRNYVGESLAAVRLNLPGSLAIFALMPALVEEIFFRGFFFQGLGGGKTAVLGSALLFALMHMNFNQICYAFAAGFVLGTVILITRNLTASMIMHFVFNGISVLITCLGDSRIIRQLLGLHLAGYYPLYPVLYKDGALAVKSVILGALISVLCLAALIFLLRRFVQKKEEEKEFSETGTWTGPDWRMAAGCIICILVAASREFL